MGQGSESGWAHQLSVPWSHACSPGAWGRDQTAGLEGQQVGWRLSAGKGVGTWQVLGPILSREANGPQSWTERGMQGTRPWVWNENREKAMGSRFLPERSTFKTLEAQPSRGGLAEGLKVKVPAVLRRWQGTRRRRFRGWNIKTASLWASPASCLLGGWGSGDQRPSF